MVAVKNIPKPVGMTLGAAARHAEQTQIVSHRGALSAERMEALLGVCAAAGYSRDVWIKRGRELIFQ
jgi:hypothetical protein